MTTINLVLPKPFKMQRTIAIHPAKIKVLAVGRRGGKTAFGGLLGVGGQPQYGLNRGLLDGKRVFLSSTSQDQSDYFWEYITSWLSPLTGSRQFYKNENSRIIRLGTGYIKVKTGRHPDALRGGNADLLILDECAFLDPEAWRKVGLPMLLDTDGDAYLLSSPNRRNWFWEEFARALADTTGASAAWNYPTHVNPYISPAAIARLAENMSEDDYRQEILGEFLEGKGSVFRYIAEAARLQRREPYTGGRFIFGVDWARDQDYTVIMVMDSNTKEVVDYLRFNQIEYRIQRGRLRELYDRWRPKVIIAEANSVGAVNIEELQSEGLPVVPFMTTGQSKPPLIESLVLAFDRREIGILEDDQLITELMAYERTVGASGRSQYSAPAGIHDDCVIALALAWYGCINFAGSLFRSGGLSFG